MLELINTVACVALMAFSLPIAMAIGNKGLWLERLSIVAVQIGLFLQVVNPWVGWAPAATWTEVYLNAAAVVMLTVWRRRAWIFVRSYLAPTDDLEHKRRRSDWMPDVQPMPGVIRYPWSGTPKA